MVSYDLYRILRRQWTEGTPFNYRIENEELKINVYSGILTAAVVSDGMKQRLCDILDDLKNYNVILMEFMNLIEYFEKIKSEHIFLSTAIENNIINKILKRTYKTSCSECEEL